MAARRRVELLRLANRNEISVDDEDRISQLWRADSLERKPTDNIQQLEGIHHRKKHQYVSEEKTRDGLEGQG